MDTLSIIEQAIKSYELDLLSMGNTYVMKSHKGEQVIEKVDIILIYKVEIFVCLSDHNSETHGPICLKFWLGTSGYPREYS